MANLADGNMIIMKCEKCQDGYLIVKDGKGSGPFLDCNKYKQGKTGCNNYLTKDNYLRFFRLNNSTKLW